MVQGEDRDSLRSWLQDDLFSSVSYREPMILHLPQGPLRLYLAGVRGADGSLTVFLAGDRQEQAEMMSIRLRQLGPPQQDDSALYEDLTRITNEMMAMQRRLENANRELAYQKERIRVTMDSIGEGVISTDMEGMVHYINDQGKALLGLDECCLGQAVHDVVPGILEEEGGLEAMIERVLVQDGGPIRLMDVPLLCGEPPCPVLDITLSAIRDQSGKVAGGVVVFFKDVSEKKRAQEALANANRKLNLLSSITRHDILNTLTALMGYLDLARMRNQEPGLEDYMHKMQAMAERINAQVSATRDYQEVGIKEAMWVDLSSTIAAASSLLDLGDIHLEIDLPPGLQIYADPMVNKVFYNLMENTLRHGKDARNISFHTEGLGRSLLLVYSDDGGGVELPYKEKIFRREHYSNTGFGLFLSREILGITGMEILENGVPGEGVRFEIKISPDAYRLNAS
jgi:signal transduction histidine kinase